MKSVKINRPEIKSLNGTGKMVQWLRVSANEPED